MLSDVKYEIKDGTIIIDESTIDLFDYYDQPIPIWEPTNKIKPYSELKVLKLDIETTGIDPYENRLTLIGLIDERGKSLIITHEDENIMILRFLSVFNKIRPDIFTGFYQMHFDLRFIITRCELLQIPQTLFRVDNKPTTIKTAQLFGKPIEFEAVRVFYGDARYKHTAIIDLYHQVLQWDFVKRKLTKHTLKQSVLQMGLRKEARLELSYEEMLAEWVNREINGMVKLKEYLQYDLEDTKLLADFLLPSVYYQKMFLNEQWKLQSISTSGNGSKWNSIIQDQYKGTDDYEEPESDRKLKYEGGLTAAISGFYRNVCKMDVQSLYPSIMLTYGIYSRKDTFAYSLMILLYLKTERIRLKKIAEDKSDRYTADEKAAADQMQGTMKILINSLYGSLSTQGIAYNDFIAAAMVTAYGRCILRLMMSSLQEYGCKNVSMDTDGIFYHVEPGKEKAAHEYVQSKMPEGIILEFELHAKAFYSPPAASSMSDNDDEDEEGLRKNYIIFYNPKKDGSPGGYKATGKFRKRDKSKLEKEFTPQYLLKYLDDGEEAAETYYNEILQSMHNGEYPTEDLAITRKIRKGEKRLVEQGIGEEGEVVTIYRTHDEQLYSVKTGKPLKNKAVVWTKDAECNYVPYITMIKEQYTEIRHCIDRGS